MFVPLVLAAALTPSAPPGPLSPADLPPPPPPAPGPAVAPPPVLVTNHLGLSGRMYPLPAAEFPARAVAAVAALPGFRYAAAEPGGVVRGYTDDTRVVVLAAPTDTGVVGLTLVATRSAAARERAKSAVTAALRKPPAGPPGPARAGTPDPALDRGLPALDWHRETRPHTPFGYHFPAAAGLAAERRGYNLKPEAGGEGWAAVAGGRPADDRAFQAFMVNCVGPGGGMTTTFVVATAGGGTAEAAAEVRAVCEAVVRCFYD
ncbi:MAG: hypothetical protein K2X87_27360 [Gemmataceae bacterium]|nr:hypothetical protein [Gemmataceae bacterium]